MTPLEIIAIGAVGFMLGHFVARLSFHRHIDGPAFREEMRRQLDIAFRAGMMTAADIVTMMEQEDVAGRLRMVVSEMRPANENI